MAVCNHSMGIAILMFQEHATVEQITVGCLDRWGKGQLKQTGHMTWEWIPGRDA